jgi:hypothetical protein
MLEQVEEEIGSIHQEVMEAKALVVVVVVECIIIEITEEAMVVQE